VALHLTFINVKKNNICIFNFTLTIILYVFCMGMKVGSLTLRDKHTLRVS
jgi:hypothetical protein